MKLAFFLVFSLGLLSAASTGIPMPKANADDIQLAIPGELGTGSSSAGRSSGGSSSNNNNNNEPNRGLAVMEGFLSLFSASSEQAGMTTEHSLPNQDAGVTTYSPSATESMDVQPGTVLTEVDNQSKSPSKGIAVVEGTLSPPSSAANDEDNFEDKVHTAAKPTPLFNNASISTLNSSGQGSLSRTCWIDWEPSSFGSSFLTFIVAFLDANQVLSHVECYKDHKKHVRRRRLAAHQLNNNLVYPPYLLRRDVLKSILNTLSWNIGLLWVSFNGIHLWCDPPSDSSPNATDSSPNATDSSLNDTDTWFSLCFPEMEGLCSSCKNHLPTSSAFLMDNMTFSVAHDCFYCPPDVRQQFLDLLAFNSLFQEQVDGPPGPPPGPPHSLYMEYLYFAFFLLLTDWNVSRKRAAKIRSWRRLFKKQNAAVSRIQSLYRLRRWKWRIHRRLQQEEMEWYAAHVPNDMEAILEQIGNEDYWLRKTLLFFDIQPKHFSACREYFYYR